MHSDVVTYYSLLLLCVLRTTHAHCVHARKTTPRLDKPTTGIAALVDSLTAVFLQHADMRAAMTTGDLAIVEKTSVEPIVRAEEIPPLNSWPEVHMASLDAAATELPAHLHLQTMADQRKNGFSQWTRPGFPEYGNLVIVSSPPWGWFDEEHDTRLTPTQVKQTVSNMHAMVHGCVDFTKGHSCTVLLHLPIHQYGVWASAFAEHGFTCEQYPITVQSANVGSAK